MSKPAAPVSPLTGKSRRALRARAHGLKPVVWIAEHGASPGVLREIDRALAAHELVKIHAAVEGRSARNALLTAICTALGAQPVHIIGKMLVAFRLRPDAPEPEPSAARNTRSAERRGRAPAAEKRTASRPTRARSQ